MVTLTFPDGARREYPDNSTGLDVAKAISPSLAKRTVAMALDGVLADLTDKIEKSAKIEFVSRDDPRALELIRHDCAHVMAEAVQTLWPGTQVTIGPVIENGFYYDFFRNEPFRPEDFPAIEKKMREIVARDKPFSKEVWSREQAKKVFRDKGENFKIELIDTIPAGEALKIYKQGDWFDLCRGPHMTSVGKIGNAFKLMKVAGAYWRGDSKNPMLTRIYGTAWAEARRARPVSAPARRGREARPPPARARDGSVSFPGRGAGRRLLAPQGLDAVPGAGELHSPPPGRGRLRGSECAAADGFLALGRVRPHGKIPRDDVHHRGARGRSAALRHQADELPGPYPDFQERAEVATAICLTSWPSSARCTASSLRARCTGCCACAPSRRTTPTCSSPTSR